MAGRRGGVAGRLWRLRFTAVYLVLAAWFAGQILHFYDRQTGWTSLLLFGDRFAAQRLPRLHDARIYTYPKSDGYDGQFYAQMAVAGNPFDRDLAVALDNPSYRARRVLLPVTAHLLGLGHPVAILWIYALSNVVCWLILAWLLARWWFPPDSLDNLLRWAGTLFGAGLLVSVARALTDGPSLLLIGVGVRCLERNRRWLGAGILGAAGLVRETSVIAAGALVSPARPDRRWFLGWLPAVLCILPAVTWAAVLYFHSGALSKGALDVPLAGLLKELRGLGGGRRPIAGRHEIYVVLSTLTQVAFIFCRPQPRTVWWRVGLAFSVLFLFLGWPFWEDPVSGIPRAVAPLALAFNALVPRTRRGLALLALGNLTVLSAPHILGNAPTEQSIIAGGNTTEGATASIAPEGTYRTSVVTDP